MHVLFPTTTAGHRRWLGGGGLLVTTLAITFLVGWPGLLVGGLLVVVWTRLAPEYTFALGQFALVMGAPALATLHTGGGLRLLLVGLGEASLLTLLLAPPADSDRPHTHRRLASLASVIAISTLGGWWIVHRLDSIWPPVIGGAVLAALLVGGLHHYEYTQLAQQESSPDYE